MDAVMIALAMWTLNIFHPARLLGYGAEWRADKNINRSEGEARDSATITDPGYSVPEEPKNWQ